MGHNRPWYPRRGYPVRAPLPEVVLMRRYVITLVLETQVVAVVTPVGER
jgi:hypothetical protein